MPAEDLVPSVDVMTHAVSTRPPRRREVSPLAAALLAIAGNMLAVGILAVSGLLVLVAAAVVFGSALLHLV